MRTFTVTLTLLILCTWGTFSSADEATTQAPAIEQVARLYPYPVLVRESGATSGSETIRQFQEDESVLNFVTHDIDDGISR